jgi:hypothetical protein
LLLTVDTAMMTTAPQVPAKVLTGVRKRWPDRADVWTNRVQAELDDLCQRYRAIPRRGMPARDGFVVAVDTPDGALVMRASPDPDGPIQAQVAAALADLGVSPAAGALTPIGWRETRTPSGRLQPASKIRGRVT